MSDFVNCAVCGVEQCEEDSPISCWRGLLCQSCWYEAEEKESSNYPKYCCGMEYVSNEVVCRSCGEYL